MRISDLSSDVCSSDLTPEELQDYLLRSLPREWMPSVLKRVDQFPLNHNGKVDRRALSQLLAQDSPLSTSGFPSGREQSDNSMVDITIAAWRACFEDPTLTADADFLQLGVTRSPLCISVFISKK